MILRLDLGAHELDAVHLAVSGNATPGGTVTIDTSGTPGLQVLLFTASARGRFLARPFGVGFSNRAGAFSNAQVLTIK